MRVGSKDFGESIIVAELYAAALEARGFQVERNMFRGDAMKLAQLVREGAVDVYPEYTGTGYMVVLGLGMPADPSDMLDKLRAEYGKLYNATWLNASGAQNSQGLAVPRSLRLETLSELAVAAPHLRLAAPKEFFARPDGLVGLKKTYGGFNFRALRPRRLGEQYDALTDGDADVVAVSTTDPQIERLNLLVLTDDRRFWPPYQIAPVVARAALDANPNIVSALNGLTLKLTQGALEELDDQVYNDGRDPADVAATFVKSFVVSRSGSPAR